MSPPPRLLVHLLIPALLLAAALGTLGTRYWQPEGLLWDEIFHIASARKQLEGVMYMEPHPPLGKMLIALADRWFSDNAQLNAPRLLDREQITSGHLPAGFSFVGVRLPSVAMAILAVLLAYAVLLRITGERVLAGGMASLLLLDNAFVLHSRAAMLEGMQICLSLAAILAFAVCVTRPTGVRLGHYLVVGLLVGLAIAIKINAAVLLLLLPALFLVDQWPALREGRWRRAGARLARAAPLATLAVAGVLAAVFYLHVATATTPMPKRTYQASPAYLAHLEARTTWTPAGFAVGLRDNLRFMAGYSAGIRRLDPEDPAETGSHASRWPLGGKAINYRWKRYETPGETRVGYFYLVANPVVWLAALAGIGLSTALLLRHAVSREPRPSTRLLPWMALFTGLYFAYMIAIMQIGRVMFLYHYLLPLTFGLLNLALLWRHLFALAPARVRDLERPALAALVLGAAACFAYFAPLTYGLPLSETDLDARQWLPLWQLTPVR